MPRRAQKKPQPTTVPAAEPLNPYLTARLRAINDLDWSFATGAPKVRDALSGAHRALVTQGADSKAAAATLMELAAEFDAAIESVEQSAHQCYDDDRNGLGISLSMTTQLMAVRGPSSVETLQDAHSMALMAARVAEVAGSDGGSDSRILGRAASLLSELSAGLVTAGLYFLGEEAQRDG